MSTRRMSIYGILAVFALSVFVGLVATTPASASLRGRRNTAWALTGGSALSFLTGHSGAGLLLGGGAAYAWKRVGDERRAQQTRVYYYQGRYYYVYPTRR